MGKESIEKNDLNVCHINYNEAEKAARAFFC